MRAALIAAALLLGTAAVQAAPPARDPDWPCQQIKVPLLSVGAVWNGPPLDPYLATWSNDAEAADLARRVAQRRLSVEQAGQAIRAFAQEAGAEKREKLLALAAGLFATLDAERAQVLAGLDRFGRRQKSLAGTIRGDMAKLRTEQAAAGPDAEQHVAQLGTQLGWETRLFEQRRQAVAYACDVPNLIEQRLYALARIIQPLID